MGKGGGPSLPVTLNSGGSSDIHLSIQELCVGIGAGSFKICATTGTGASTDLIVVSDSWSLSNATFECILKGSIIGIRVIIVTGGSVSTCLVVGCVAFCSHLDSWDSAVFVWLCLPSLVGNHLPPRSLIIVLVTGCNSTELTVEPFSPERLFGMLLSGISLG